MDPVWVGIGLGSNQGPSEETLAAAIRTIRSNHRLLRVSSLFETAPVGKLDQPPFLNAAVLVESVSEPRALLEELQQIEREHGRDRAAEERHGPRTLDLDILLVDGREVDEPGLSIPHPRLMERRFALEPLIEVWPNGELPDGTRLIDGWGAVVDQESTKRSGPGWLKA